MLGYFCRRSRPIRSTEIVLAKYGIREIKAKNFELVTLRFELSRVRVSQGKITVNVWRKSRGIRFLFELALASSYTESTVLWSHLRFLASRVLFSSSDTNESADSSLQSFYKTYLHNGAGQVCIALQSTILEDGTQQATELSKYIPAVTHWTPRPDTHGTNLNERRFQKIATASKKNTSIL